MQGIDTHIIANLCSVELLCRNGVSPMQGIDTQFQGFWF